MRQIKYVMVEWPDSQMLMDQDWFDECLLINSGKLLDEYGSSAYMVPEEKLTELLKKQ